MAEYKKVLEKSKIAPGSCQLVQVDGQAIALFNVEGQIYALNNACPHRGGPLAEGDLVGKVVTCPWHGWSFDVCTGTATHTPAQAKTYPVKIDGEDILVEV